jgi:trimethylamine--corrinoid protein Co-methyltransferase
MQVKKVNFLAQATPSLSFMSPDQLYELHLATLEVLERVGVRVDEDEALDLLKQAGAYLEGRIARIPAHLVKAALQSAPERIVMCNRKGERTLFLEANMTYYGTGSDLPFTIDVNTGERRISTKQDVVNATRVVDALPNFDFMMSFAIAQDTPAAVSDLHQMEAMINNTGKPIVVTAHHRQSMLDQIEMAAAIMGGYEELRRKPLLACYDEPICPLTHTVEGTQKLLVLAEYGIPAIYVPGMLGGGSAPVTQVGTLVQGNAELLSGLVIHQLKAPGAPFIYGGCPSIMDQRTTNVCYGNPEWHMNAVVWSQMSRMYRLPIFSTGGCTDALVFDQQAGIEQAYSLLLAQLSGANLIHDVGYLESGLTGSLETLVSCDEIIGMVRHIGRGYEVNRETLAIEAMERVGPGGNYMVDEHTLDHYKELWWPELLNRGRYDDWKAAGSKTFKDKCNAKAKRILEDHEPEPLPEDVRKTLSDIVARATARCEGV